MINAALIIVLAAIVIAMAIRGFNSFVDSLFPALQGSVGFKVSVEEVVEVMNLSYRLTPTGVKYQECLFKSSRGVRAGLGMAGSNYDGPEVVVAFVGVFDPRDWEESICTKSLDDQYKYWKSTDRKVHASSSTSPEWKEHCRSQYKRLRALRRDLEAGVETP